MKMNWRGDGRKVTYNSDPKEEWTYAPLVLEWHLLAGESTYSLQRYTSEGFREILFLRIPDHAWQSTTPSFYNEEERRHVIHKLYTRQRNEESALFSSEKGTNVPRLLPKMQALMRLPGWAYRNGQRLVVSAYVRLRAFLER